MKTSNILIRRQTIIQAIINELGFGWYQAKMILILGVAHSTDTLETIVQAVLVPILQCDWQLSLDSSAFLTTLIFLGSCIGAVPLGYSADVFGRQSMCLTACITLMYLSWLTSISPTYSWMAALKFMSGIFIGGVLTSGSSLLSETMPISYRATAQVMTSTFESLIGLITASIGLICFQNDLNWRYFLFLTTAPLVFLTFGLAFCTQESPIYLFGKKQMLEAAYVLDTIAITNNRLPRQPPPVYKNIRDRQVQNLNTAAFSFTGRLVHMEDDEKLNSKINGLKEISILLFNKRPWLSLLLFLMNFLWGFLIYGGITILPVELTRIPSICLQSIGHKNASLFYPNRNEVVGDVGCCRPLNREVYTSLLYSASGGLLSFPVAYIFLKWFGQLWSITASFASVGSLLFIQAFCLPNPLMNILFFITRAFGSAGYSITCIVLNSIVQARVSSLTTGLGAMAFRSGILIAPYLGQVFLQKQSSLLTILIFSMTAFLGAALSVLLPSPRISVDEQKVRKKKPILRNIFKRRQRMTAEEAIAMAAGQVIKSRKRYATQKSVFFSPKKQEMDISVIEDMYKNLTEKNVDGIIHQDFVNRNSIFEVDT